MSGYWDGQVDWNTLFKSVFVPQNLKLRGLTGCSVFVWMCASMCAPYSHFLHLLLRQCNKDTRQGSKRASQFPDCNIPDSDFKAGLVFYFSSEGQSKSQHFLRVWGQILCVCVCVFVCACNMLLPWLQLRHRQRKFCLNKQQGVVWY